MHVITGTHAITKNHMGNKMQHAFTNDMHNTFNDEWKHHWVSYLNTFDKRININETHLQHLHVYEQIGCDKYDTNLRVEITNGDTIVYGDLIDIDEINYENECRDMVARYMEIWNNKCDKIIIRFYHSRDYDNYDGLGIGFDTMTNCNEPYFAHCYKWLLLLMIYDNYRENDDTNAMPPHNALIASPPTNIEKILYDEYLLKKLIQF